MPPSDASWQTICTQAEKYHLFFVANKISAAGTHVLFSLCDNSNIIRNGGQVWSIIGVLCTISFLCGEFSNCDQNNWPRGMFCVCQGWSIHLTFHHYSGRSISAHSQESPTTSNHIKHFLLNHDSLPGQDDVSRVLPLLIMGGMALVGAGLVLFAQETYKLPLPETIEDVERSSHLKLLW